MKNIFVDEIKLLKPEYYHEIEGFDVRIAIAQFNDLESTFGDIMTSLIYSREDNFGKIDNGLEKNLIRRFHLRHAIIDLNNSFDLLLQVPWLFYRIWEGYNSDGSLRTKYLKNMKYGNENSNIKRNSTGWVEHCRRNCSAGKVLKYLEDNPEAKLNLIADRLKEFEKIFIFNEHKNFTIRKLSNNIKHKQSLKIKELYDDPDFNLNLNLNLNGENINVKECGKLVLNHKFSDKSKVLGEYNTTFSHDLYVDIKYYSGEEFRAEDYINKGDYISFKELENEIYSYYNEISDIVKLIYNTIEPFLHKNPTMDEMDIVKKHTINLDKYFIPNK